MVDKLKEQMMADYQINLSGSDLVNALFHNKQTQEHSATQGSVDVLKEQVKGVDRRVSELKESTEKRFDDVDKRFDRMDKKLDKIIWLFMGTLVALAAKMFFSDFLM